MQLSTVTIQNGDDFKLVDKIARPYYTAGLFFQVDLLTVSNRLQKTASIIFVLAGLLCSAGHVGCRNGNEPVAPPASGESSKPKMSSPITTANVAAAAPIPPAILPKFVDVAAELNVAFTFFNDAVPERFFLPEVMGGGAGWIDFDLDGWLDLFLVNGSELRADQPPSSSHPNGLYQNLGTGKFRSILGAAGAVHAGFGQGCAVGDFDADGFPDLYVAYYGQDCLFHNRGDGTFAEITAAAGIRDDLWGSSVAWLDLDADFQLDLYVVNYLNVTLANHRVCPYENHGPGYCGPGDFDAVPDQVYRSMGDGSFSEVTEEFGFSAPEGKGLGVVVADFDEDLQSEIYVANDMAPNFMFTRGGARSRKPYIEIGYEAGCAVSESGLHEASMGLACADFDRDGLPDIYLTHFFAQKNTLYRNLGKLSFVDDSRRTRVAATSFHTNGFGTCAIDYDRDGANDLLVANGHVLGKHHVPNEMEAQLLRNDGRGRFADISSLAGPYFTEKVLGRSLAAGDYDADGDLDTVITHLDRPVAVLRNDTAAGKHFLGLALETECRIPPVGGRVIVRSGASVQIVPIVSGGSYLSSPDPRLLLGVEGPTADVEIHWNSGRVDRFPGMQVDKYWRFLERVGSRATFVAPAFVP